ncbi:MAG: hypothetical protein UU95_C0014G0001, partial [Parcubacteria group bacterium GW2011_GWC2_42_12]
MKFPDDNFFRMQSQRETIAEESRNRLNQIFQIRPIRRCYREIISIADIIFNPKRMFHKLIKLIHINIGKKLGCKVANGNTFPHARIYSLSLSLSDWRGRVTPNNGLREPHRVFILYPFPENFKENFVVHAIKKFFDIALKNKTIPRAVSRDRP